MPQPLGELLSTVSPRLVAGLLGVWILLTLGALAAFALPWLKPGRDHSNLRQRVASWWVMVAMLSVALLLGWPALVLLFAVVSFIGLREFLSLAPISAKDRLLIWAAYLAIPANYALVAFDDYGVYLVFIPVWLFLVLPFAMACIGETQRYLPRAAIVHWGLVTCVYSIGFIPFLARTPPHQAPQAGPTGMVFFLLLATELNDVAQYCWGKALGRRKIMPKVSPNKTWEGFLGGWATTAALIWFVGPLFIPLHGLGLATLAFALPLAGFAGDVTMSAIKRDIGVKDTSRLIPGHGGVLDRIDSLTFAGPVYFHILVFFALSPFT